MELNLSALKMLQEALHEKTKYKEGMSVTEFQNGLNRFVIESSICLVQF